MIPHRLARVWSGLVVSLGVAAGIAASASASVRSYRVDIPAQGARVVSGAAGDRVEVPGAGWDTSVTPGAPALPHRLVHVLLPQGEGVSSFTFTFGAEARFGSSARIALAGALESSDGGRVDAPATATAPALTARVDYLGTGVLHGHRIASFAVHPFSLRDGELVGAASAEIRIDTRPESGGVVEPVRRRDDRREAVRGRIARMVVNPGDLGAYTFREVAVAKPAGGFQPTSFPSLEGSDVDYVIITTDALAATFQGLADWKTAKGVPTVVRTVEWIAANYRNGSDLAETVRTFVADAYALWGIKYVLIGGDVEQVPARFAFSAFYAGGKSLPVDMYFGCLDGDWNADHDAVFGEYGSDAADLYAEVHVGRLPARNPAEAAVMINKVKDYERPLHLAYGKKILLLGEVLFPSNYKPGDVISLNGADITEFVRLSWMTGPSLTVSRNYETSSLFPGSMPETRQAAIDSINAGFNHVVHVGHGFRFNMSCGDASIVNADAAALINGPRLANLNLLNCTACAYTYECLGEYFLRNPNGGAVSVVGANESAFPSVAAYYMSEFYRLVLDSTVVNLGEAFSLSREARTGYAIEAPSGTDSGDRWTHFVYTLLGDPEMPLWTTTVQTLSVSHPASVNRGTNAITVTVTSGGNPVPGARVCLSKGDDDYETGTTDGAGQVTLSFRAESAGSISVVATGYNYKRYDGTISVGGTGAYVAINTITVDDDNAGGTSGNGNGVIEGGETVDLAFNLRNTGTAASGTITVTLRTNDIAVTVVDSTAGGGTISSGGNATMTGGCRVSFGAALPDGHPAAFVLVIKNNGVDTWRDEFKREVHQPVLALVRLRIDDTATGNGNGVVEAGEQFKLYYKVKNFGTGAYPGGAATVSDLDAAFTIVGGADTYPAIASIGSAENVAGLTMTENSVVSENRLRIQITDLYGRAFVDTVELRAPSAPGTITVDPSQGADRLSLTWVASASPDVARYNVYRSSSPGGPFTLANTDPVAHTLFMNTGLSPTTRYYYQTTAIDASGNESAKSATFSGSTNPAQVTGWPIAMDQETTSSPAVGDIDGDGDLEIVVGDKFVYAWHANGVELIDGDASPLTWGVLNTQGNGFVGHVALARIDFEAGLDIVATSRETKQVFVFDHTGANVAGWPKSVENPIRAGAAVGDLDGDNLFEIIALDESSVLYAWKADGTEFMDGDANPATLGVFKRLTVTTFAYCTPALADIDNDGRDEIIVGTPANTLYALNHDGSAVAGFPVALTDDLSGSPAVGDVDGNGDLEIVINTRNGTILALHHTGAVLWTRFTPNGKFFAPSPAIGDVTGDGKLETFVPTSNGKLYGFTDTGADMPGFPVTYSATTYTESSPVIADLDGDGLRDVLIGSEEKNIWAWNRNGVALDGFPLTTGDAMRGVPTIGDVDQDGDVDLVAAGWDKSVYVWDFTGSWNAANAPWPRFHANLHNNGRLGFVVPTPVLGATFSFTALEGGLELVWSVPVEAGTVFSVERAEVVNGVVGCGTCAYRTVARGVGAGVEGTVRVVDRGVDEGSRYVYRLVGETGDVVYETAGLYVAVRRAVLGQNYPNPFNPVTKIEYRVAELGGGSGERVAVSVVVYDVRGARVRTLVEGPHASGRYVAVWDGRDDRGSPVGSGVYFYRMTAPGFADVRKMVLLK